MGNPSPVFGRRRPVVLLLAAAVALVFFFAADTSAEDAYRFYTWVVTYGTISPMGAPQQGILINGQFPGPQLDVVTNDNLVINVINRLDEPFLLTWNGIKQRKNSWQDGVLGTNCPIPPNGANYTYRIQPKDQIGTYTYFPSTALHRAAGGFGALNVHQRSVIAIPYPAPTGGEFTVLVGDWYGAKAGGHKGLRQAVEANGGVPSPDGLLINGQQGGRTFTGDAGKTYLVRVSNVGLVATINFRIQGHRMTLVEVEGAHTIQNVYDSIDIHPGQSAAVLVALNQAPRDYYIVASTRLLTTGPQVLTATATLRYSNSGTPASGPLPPGPAPNDVDWSLQQARSIRRNLTANAARPNPQGSFHYGQIPIARSFLFENYAVNVGGRWRNSVNGVSFVVPRVPLKLADYFGTPGVIQWDAIPFTPPIGNAARLGTPAVRLNLHDFIEIVFQNNEVATQTWHLDGYDFWVVGYGYDQWSSTDRENYNLVDAVTRHTVQVYPNAWTAIFVSLDNQGMWNLRSAQWARQYLGQQLYLRVWTQQQSLANEYDIPTNALRCS